MSCTLVHVTNHLLSRQRVVKVRKEPSKGAILLLGSRLPAAWGLDRHPKVSFGRNTY